MEEVKHLDISKSSSGNIPLRIVKEYVSSYIYPLTECFNNELINHRFPDILKLADVTPAYKKGDKTIKSRLMAGVWQFLGRFCAEPRRGEAQK